MKKLAIVLFIGLAHVTTAQRAPRKEVDIQQLLDDLISYQDEDLNYEELYENYLQLLSQPLNLNVATAEQLRSLYLLSELQVQEFIAYRKEYGELLSEYELQAIPSFDLITLERLLPFITTTNSSLNKSFFNKVLNNQNNYLIFRYERIIQRKEGFISDDLQNRFQGSRDKFYTRFRTSNPNDFSIGFTAEQDAGEAFLWNPTSKQYGVDFLSFHFQVLNKGILKNLIVGDYQLQAGQGLVSGGTFSVGKGGESISTVRKSNLLGLPYTSASENSYLRGFTASLTLPKHFLFTPFFSRAYRDANKQLEGTASYFSSLQTTGLHRNNTELSDRKTLVETIAGGVLSFQHKALDAGIIHQSIHFDHPLASEPNPYNQFSFSGKSNANYSAYINYNYLNFTVFAEAAKSMNYGSAFVMGTLGSLSPQLDVALLYRNYQRDFYSFYTNSFSEASVPQNEKGFYYGMKYSIHKKIKLAGYIDFFEFPWLRYRNYSPSAGHEWLFRFQYQHNKGMIFTAQLREEEKQRNLGEESTFYLTAPGTKHSLFFNADYAVSSIVKMKTRMQFSDFTLQDVSTQGMSIFQDVTLDFGNIKLSGRYALFDTDDYDNRQYVYEKDVWLAYSFPAYAGKGVRNYVMVQYDVSRRITCWLRYAHLRLHTEDSIGSGLDMIEGSTRDDIKFQLRLKL
jgi:hypothetical protein